MKANSPTTKHCSSASDDSYLNLVRDFPLRPIRSRKDYTAAGAILDRLALLDNQLDAGQADYLETLEMLIEAYDTKHATIEPVGDTPLKRLQYLIQQNSMGPANLGDLIGSRPMASMILKGERELSKAHIRKLAERFKVDAGYFL